MVDNTGIFYYNEDEIVNPTVIVTYVNSSKVVKHGNIIDILDFSNVEEGEIITEKQINAGQTLFEEEHAEMLRKFIEKYKDKDILVICAAGIMRSYSTAICILELLNQHFKIKDYIENHYGCPDKKIITTMFDMSFYKVVCCWKNHKKKNIEAEEEIKQMFLD